MKRPASPDQVVPSVRQRVEEEEDSPPPPSEDEAGPSAGVQELAVVHPVRYPLVRLQRPPPSAPPTESAGDVGRH